MQSSIAYNLFYAFVDVKTIFGGEGGGGYLIHISKRVRVV